MKQKILGTNGPAVAALGMGCSRMSMGRPRLQNPAEDVESVATLHAGLDAGLNFIDTADFYGCGHSEMLVAQVLKERRNDVFLSVKNGAMFAPSGQFIGLDARPKSIKNFCTYSLQRLGVDVIDLYQPGRADPDVPYEDTIGAIAELIKDGKVRYLGVSEVGAENLRKAHGVHPVTALEIEYSLVCRFIETEILPTARELGIGIVAYRVLADGLLTGGVTGEPAGPHAHMAPPRMRGENLVHNLEKMKFLHEFAAARGLTTAQIAVAWLLTRGEDILPIIGVSRRARLAENLSVLDISFTPDELAALDKAYANGSILGGRYPEFVLKYAAQ